MSSTRSKNILQLIEDEYIIKILRCCINNRECDLTKNIQEHRQSFIKKIINHYRLVNLSTRFNLVKKITENVVEALSSLGFQTLIIDARLRTQALFGASQGVLESVFEVGMSWDYILDLPLIPSSSVKGAVRGTLEQLLRSEYDIPRTNKECNNCLEYVNILFGTGGHEGWTGLLLFFDAYPLTIKNSSGRLLEPDIISPHYMHGTEVVRFERLVEPVPVPHVSIAPGVVFRFIVAAKPTEEVEEALNGLMRCFGKNAKTSLRSKIASLLATVFRYGIGARTSRGYGKFEVDRMEIRIGENTSHTPIFLESTTQPLRKEKGT